MKVDIPMLPCHNSTYCPHEEEQYTPNSYLYLSLLLSEFHCDAIIYPQSNIFFPEGQEILVNRFYGTKDYRF
jgi:hypothetical protein